MSGLTVGFTGTQKGVTALQKKRVASLLQALVPNAVVHGGCIGADSDFSLIWSKFHKQHDYQYDFFQCVFPSNIKSTQGEIYGQFILYPEKPPLVRNKIIVDKSDIIIAAPRQEREIIRSGTWSTIGYARKKEKPIYIVFSSGTIRPN